MRLSRNGIQMLEGRWISGQEPVTLVVVPIARKGTEEDSNRLKNLSLSSHLLTGITIQV